MDGRKQRADYDLRAWKAQTLKRLERAYLQKALRQHGGNVSQTARALGIHRSTLQRLMRRHSFPPG